MYTIIRLRCFMFAVNFFTDVCHLSDSLANFLTFLFVCTFSTSVCKNQIMYAHKNIMQHVLETDCCVPQHY